MLKTLYSKYLVSFIFLLGIGFCTIAVIISAVVTTYSINTKTDLMNKTAQMVYFEISNEMTADNCDFETAIKRNEENIKKVFNVITEYSESDIVLVNEDGNIIFKNAADSVFAATKISSATLKEINQNAGLSIISDLGGLFNTRRFNYIYPVEERVAGNNKPIGYIILTSSASGMSMVYEQIIKTVLIASLWVFFAAIIIVYFITDRITTSRRMPLTVLCRFCLKFRFLWRHISFYQILKFLMRHHLVQYRIWVHQMVCWSLVEL